MRYLVTGAAGFIGSHLTSQLIKDGHEVLAVDNFTSYYSRDLKIERERQLLNPVGIKVNNLDLQDLESLRALFEKNQFDSVIHLAAQPGVRLQIANHDSYVRDNLLAFSNVLICVRQYEVPSFMYASSSSVYGNCQDALFSELRSPTVPVSFYGGTKLANEILAQAGCQNFATRTRALRFFTVYGKWGRPDMAYFRILASALDNFDFTMFGNGSVLRDFTFVDDVVDSIIKLDMNLRTQIGGFFDSVNIGGGNPHTLNQLVNTFENLLNKRIRSNLDEANSSDVNRTCADSKYLNMLIDSVPTTSLVEGLQIVTEWALAPGVRAHLAKWAGSVP